MGSSETGWTARFYPRRGRTCAPSLTAPASGNCVAARPEVAQNEPCCSSMCHGRPRGGAGGRGGRRNLWPTGGGGPGGAQTGPCCRGMGHGRPGGGAGGRGGRRNLCPTGGRV